MFAADLGVAWRITMATVLISPAQQLTTNLGFASEGWSDLFIRTRAQKNYEVRASAEAYCPPFSANLFAISWALAYGQSSSFLMSLRAKIFFPLLYREDSSRLAFLDRPCLIFCVVLEAVMLSNFTQNLMFCVNEDMRRLPSSASNADYS
jgi:hypothetical protein